MFVHLTIFYKNVYFQIPFLRYIDIYFGQITDAVVIIYHMLFNICMYIGIDIAIPILSVFNNLVQFS